MAAVFGPNKDEFVTSMAALVLYDGGAEITSDSIKDLLSATNNTVAPYWPALFAGFLKNGRIETLVFSTGGASAAPAAGGAAPAAAAAAPAEEKKAEKPKVEEVDALDGGISFGASSY